MKRFGLMVIMSGWMVQGAMAASQETARLTCELTDGSSVIGTVNTTSFRFRTAFADVKMPWMPLQRIAFNSDGESVRLDFRNGDKLTGFLYDETLELTTLIGEIRLPVNKVRDIRVRRLAKSGAAGLLLWNRMGSRDEIAGSEVGPDGTCVGGTFGSGKFGQAFVVRYDQNRQVTFPAEEFNAGAGCIEFWVKFSGLPRELAWGQNPTLMRLCGGQTQYLLHLNGNDGNSRGGLCAQVGPFAGCGTGTYGSWTYEQVLGVGKAEDWHHYAMVWDKDGIAKVGDGRQRVAVYLDGVLNSSESGNGDVAVPTLKDAQLEVLFNMHLRQGTIAYDNLKVWNYAKTDFSDRNEE